MYGRNLIREIIAKHAQQFQSSAYDLHGIDDYDDADDDEIDELISALPSPPTTANIDFTYKPRKLSFKQYQKDVKERPDQNGSIVLSDSVCA